MKRRGIFCSALLTVLALLGFGLELRGEGSIAAAALIADAANYEAAGDMNKACELYYKAAAEFDSPEAQRILGTILLEGRGGVEANPEYAAAYFALAADHGDVESIHRLAECYFNGTGVEKDPARAVELWSSISGRLPDADYSLGMCCLNGWGTTANAELAFIHLVNAAIRGHLAAKCELALLYEQGVGTARDYGMAYRLLSEAAEYGEPLAEYHLGRFYEDGIGVVCDLDRAYVYYYRARSRGHRRAARGLERLEARGFKPRTPRPPVPAVKHRDGAGGRGRLRNPNRAPSAGQPRPANVKPPRPQTDNPARKGQPRPANVKPPRPQTNSPARSEQPPRPANVKSPRPQTGSPARKGQPRPANVKPPRPQTGSPARSEQPPRPANVKSPRPQVTKKSGPEHSVRNGGSRPAAPARSGNTPPERQLKPERNGKQTVRTAPAPRKPEQTSTAKPSQSPAPRRPAPEAPKAAPPKSGGAPRPANVRQGDAVQMRGHRPPRER